MKSRVYDEAGLAPAFSCLHPVRKIGAGYTVRIDREALLIALTTAAAHGDAKAAAFLPFYVGWLRQQRAS
jgi:hypothetical protein